MSDKGEQDDNERGGCDYQGYEFGAGSYPDSICIEGQLYDADDCDDSGNLYEREEEIPCPVCRPADAIDYWTEQNQLSGSSERTARLAAKDLVTDILNNRGLMVNTL
jgi:hypothetical protein